jgi:hypothetical protein
MRVLSAAQHDPSARPNTNNDGAQGDDNIAIKNNTEYDGDSGTSQKDELTSPDKGVSGTQAQYSGRQ